MDRWLITSVLLLCATAVWSKAVDAESEDKAEDWTEDWVKNEDGTFSYKDPNRNTNNVENHVINLGGLYKSDNETEVTVDCTSERRACLEVGPKVVRTYKEVCGEDDEKKEEKKQAKKSSHGWWSGWSSWNDFSWPSWSSRCRDVAVTKTKTVCLKWGFTKSKGC